jgi:hypothetical protein
MDTSIPISYPTGTVVWVFNEGARFSKHIQYAVHYFDEVDNLGFDSVWFDKHDKVVRIETHDGIFWEDLDWVSAGQQEA